MKIIKVSNFYQRTVTGILYVAITIVAILINPIAAAALFFVVALFTVGEFLKTFKGRARPQVGFSLIISALVYVVIALRAIGIFEDQHLALLILPVIAIFPMELFRKEKTPFLNMAVLLVALVYVVIPLALLNNIYQFGLLAEGKDYQFLLTFFILVWINDTGAYLTGLLIGKHKLFPSVSPKKTWEGFFGGVLLTLLAGWVAGFYIFDFQGINYVVCAGIIIIFATIGDLVESLLKRDFNVKDSGSILPGHGGLLDRFDGVLLSSPVIFLYIKFFI